MRRGGEGEETKGLPCVRERVDGRREICGVLARLERRRGRDGTSVSFGREREESRDFLRRANRGTKGVACVHLYFLSPTSSARLSNPQIYGWPNSHFPHLLLSFISSKPNPPLRSSNPSRSQVSRKSVRLNVATSDSPAVADPAADVLAAGETGGEKFDWYSHWYPLAPVCDLDKRAPRALRVIGLDLVVWWDREVGQWRVFADRCPHRLAPLSEGRIDRWGRLQCVYHGWCFDGDGSCKLIPQAPEDGPQVHNSSKACATSYPCCVQNNIVWFWPQTEPQHKDILMKNKPPSISELDDPSYTYTMGMRDMPYGYEVLIENLMDPAHVPYAHHKIMRIPKRPPSLTR
ncbi:hypothetical protein IEQ34_012162 [Dendrobium chrysotoxum]|uniref:Rieske domain-containing protein n=1 Tax=Dendrobium chrysotoxum TaxID=161865 RepID=A0AAV7GUM8_DENCH|nr:hypothetical protein IEQ34_012162 [Dendrobium chrysotoxum]